MRPQNKNLKKGKPFKKGGDARINKKGRPPKLPQLDVLLAKVLGEEKDGKNAAEVILMALRAKATKGDIRAAEVLLDRAFGKAKQALDLTTDGQPIDQKAPVIKVYTSGPPLADSEDKVDK